MLQRTTGVMLGVVFLALGGGCAADEQERLRDGDGLALPGPVAETHAIVEGSRDPLVAREGALLSVRCLAFDSAGLVTSSIGLQPALRRGIGLAKVRAEGWLELLAAGRVEVVCDYPDAVVRTTVVMVDPLPLEEVAAAPSRSR